MKLQLTLTDKNGFVLNQWTLGDNENDPHIEFLLPLNPKTPGLSLLKEVNKGYLVAVEME